MTALFCDVILERKLLGARPGAPILYDLRSSRVVPETLRARGAEPIRSRVGHAFMKAVMRERGACFGGELSGHYYFRFPAGYIGDDGAAAMMLLLEALDARSAPALRAVAAVPALPPERRDQPARRRRARQTLARVRAAYPDGDADELDGLTVSYPDWWFNLRPSNTEPLLRLNLEAPDDAVARARRAARADRGLIGAVTRAARPAARRGRGCCCARALALAVGCGAVPAQPRRLRRWRSAAFVANLDVVAGPLERVLDPGEPPSTGGAASSAGPLLLLAVLVRWCCCSRSGSRSTSRSR